LRRGGENDLLRGDHHDHDCDQYRNAGEASGNR
jgi:hypothetical protein